MHTPHIVIAQGDIHTAVRLSEAIPEFGRPIHGAEEYRRRLHGTPHLLLVAEVDGVAAGFKVGYERPDGTFYSWMGGVLPAYRRLGLARRLAEAQEQWATSQGYRYIVCKTLNRHRAMIIFAVSNGFHFTAVEPRPDMAENRLWLVKRLML